MAPPPPDEADKDNARDLRRVLAVTFAWKVMALGLLLTLFWPTATVSHLVQDIRTWREFFFDVRAGLVPYVHITKEYPVLGGVLYWLMAPFVDPNDLRQTVLVHGLFMMAADLLNTVLFFGAVRRLAPGLALPLTLALGLNLTALVTAPVRYESWIVTFVLLGYRAHRDGRYRLAALWWALGCGLKWYPAFFLAAQEWRLFAVGKKRWHWVGAGLVFAGVTTLVNLPFLLWCLRENGTIANWVAPYVFHARRPLYWDTLIGVGQIWLGTLEWERYAGLWTLALMAGAVFVRPRASLEDKGVLVCLAAVVFNRIYSTQFNLWFYPFLLLGIARLGLPAARTRLLLFVLLDILNVLVYPLSFTGAVDEMGGFFPYAARDFGGAWTVVFSWAIVARTLVVIALGAALLRWPLLAPGAPAEAPPAMDSRRARHP